MKIKFKKIFFTIESRITQNKTKGCGLKHQYNTKKHAEQTRRHMERITGDFFDYYKCKLCHHFHVGHRPDYLLDDNQYKIRDQIRQTKKDQLQYILQLIKEQL